jgi:ABC-type lipoprotein export system ATPase subunit
MSEEIDHKQSLISQNEEESEEKPPEYIKALDNINVKIPSKAVTMIVGDIGSGKSSLLYAILC